MLTLKGQYITHRSCINHNKWSFDCIYKRINIKKSSRFGKNINKIHRDVITPQFANIVCMQVSQKNPTKAPCKWSGLGLG